jgi:hypothetical protein
MRSVISLQSFVEGDLSSELGQARRSPSCYGSDSEHPSARAASAGMALIFSGVGCSQLMPGGLALRGHSMISAGVTIRSTLKSCWVSGSGGHARDGHVQQLAVP